MNELITFLLTHKYLIIIALLELIAAAVLFRFGLYIYVRVRSVRRQVDGVAVYRSMVENAADEVQIVMRLFDRTPVFVTANIEEALDISRRRIMNDITVIQYITDRSSLKKLSAAYENWDGTGVFIEELKGMGGRWFRFAMRRDSAGEYEFVSILDITEFKKQIFALRNQLADAEFKSESKTRFLSQMSHEIRTPMNGIIGMLSLARNQIASEGGNGDARNYIDRIEGLSTHLLSLINDILDMSRIEAGKIEIAEEEFDLFALADKLTAMFQNNVESKGIRYSIDVLDFDARYFIGDELRITQVMTNFLSNAVKFTNEGEISVTFKEMMRDGDNAHLMMRVKDTGIGMETSFLNHLFDPFVQESAGVTRKYGGTGLGMAITDQLVKLMKGQLLVDTKLGEGTVFTVYLTLPVARDGIEDMKLSAERIEDTSVYTFEGMKILMAEDNDLNAEIAIEVLQEEGALVTRAVNGADCVEIFASNEPGTFDVILMDIQMPVMGGREAAEKIRSMSRADSADIPIFALSADAFVEDRRMSIKTGMNGHFAKPVDYDEVRITVGRLLAEKAASRN